MGVLLTADLTGHSRSSLSARKDGRAMLGQPSKGHLRRIFILFPRFPTELLKAKGVIFILRKGKGVGGWYS